VIGVFQKQDMPDTIYMIIDDYTIAEMNLTSNNLTQAGYVVKIKKYQDHVWLMAYLPKGIL